MIGSIGRFSRRIRAGSIAPAMLLVIVGPTHPDPVAKRAGSAGVIPLPGPSISASATTTRIDAATDSKRDSREDRGRVLYSAGHVPHDSIAVHGMRHHQCPDQRVSQMGRASTAPSTDDL